MFGDYSYMNKFVFLIAMEEISTSKSILLESLFPNFANFRTFWSFNYKSVPTITHYDNLNLVNMLDLGYNTPGPPCLGKAKFGQ